jgi:hypothetical protein
VKGKLVFLVPVVFVAALAASLVVFVPSRVVIKPACAFGDGAGYCAMAQGGKAGEPWNRRPVVPMVVRALPGTLAQRFRFVAVASVFLATAVSAFLADRIARALGLRDGPSRLAVAAIVVAGGLIIPHGLRLAMSVPVLVDIGGLAAGLTWMALFTSRRKPLIIAAVPAAVLAVCTREVWVLAIVLALLLALVLKRNRTVAVVTIIAVIVAVALTRMIPYVPGSYSEGRIISETFDARFGDAARIGLTAWYLVFAVGLLPMVIALRPPFGWLRDDLSERADMTAAVVLLSALVILASAPVVGTDFPRYTYPGGVLLLTFAAPWLTVHRSLWGASVVLAIATVVLWTPARGLITTEADYVRFYFPSARTFIGLTITAAAVAAAGSLTASAERRLRGR